MDKVVKSNNDDLEFIIENLEDIKNIKLKDEEIQELKNRIIENNRSQDIDPNLAVFKKLVAVRTYLEMYGNGDVEEIQALIDQYAAKFKEENINQN